MADIGKIEALLGGVREQSPAGFAIAFHIRLTSPDFLFQTYPKEWTDTYSEKGYVMVDPIVRFGFTQTGAERWSNLADDDEHGIFDQSLKYGMKYGVAISTETDGSRSVAGFARPDREYSDAEIAQLSQAVQDLHALTASSTGMPDDLRAELHRLSIEMTHPVTP